MTQAALADAAGVRAHTMWRYEAGKMRPGSDVMLRIAQALDVTVPFLITGVDADTQIEADDSVRAALVELLADWDAELHGPPPNEEEVEWLNTKIDFRQDRRAGLEITPRLLFDRLRERRRQQRGKAVERPRLEPPAPRPGTRKLGETDRRRKR